MVANIRGYTPTFNFKLINFDTPRWHTLEYANWNMVDTLFAQIGLSSIRGEWLNSTAYNVGERVFDVETNEVYKCNVAHTSAATGTFAQDRAARPTFWEAQTSGVPVYRGAWASGIFYAKGDIVKLNNYVYYLCIITHTSGAPFEPTFWTMVFDATATVADAQSAATAAQVSAAEADTSADQAAASAAAAQVAEVKWLGPWSSATAYTPNDAVGHNNSSYISKTNNTNKPPSTNPTDWDVLAMKGSDGAPGAGGGDMLSTNNLSELTDKPLALNTLNGLSKAGGTMTGDLTISKANPAVTLNKAASGEASSFMSKNGGVLRWQLTFGDGAAEAGGNSGSNISLFGFDDAGAFIGTALAINRATCLISLQGDPIAALGAVTKQYVDTRIVAAATAAEYMSNSQPNKMLTPGAVWTAATPQNVSAAGSFTLDFNAAANFWLIINSATGTMNNPTNMKPGQKGTITIQQDGAGGRNITTWGTAWKFPGGIKPTLTTTPNGVDVISFDVLYNGWINAVFNADFK